MIFKSSAVEDDLRHTSGLSALGNEGSNFGGLLHLCALGVALDLCVKRRSCRQGLPGFVVNHLRVDVVQAAEDRESRSCC